MKNTSDWQIFGNSLGFVHLVLLVDWDPIGIFGHEGAMNEYDTYALHVHDLLCSDASQEELTTYLRWVERELMGVGGNPDMPLSAVAAKLRDVFDTAQGDVAT